MKEIIQEVAGWSGAAIYIFAYFLLTMDVVSTRKVMYHLMNAVGGVLVCANALLMGDRPVLVLNFLWMLIALFAIGKRSFGSHR